MFGLLSSVLATRGSDSGAFKADEAQSRAGAKKTTVVVSVPVTTLRIRSFVADFFAVSKEKGL